jgi:hypothetical protein
MASFLVALLYSNSYLNWSSREFELLAEAAFNEATVGGLDPTAGEDHKLRWSNTSLGCVVDLWLLATANRWWCRANKCTKE